MTFDKAAFDRQSDREHFAWVQGCEGDPLGDRQAARDEWIQAMRDTPEWVGTQLEWIFNGSYGRGATRAAVRIRESKLRNKVAAYGQLLAVCACRCPAAFAIQAWKKLKPEQQEAVNKAIQEAADHPAAC